MSGTTFHFVENSADTGGTLTLHDTTSNLTAHIHMTGHYSKSDFILAPDHGAGTAVKFVRDDEGDRERARVREMSQA